MTSSAFSARRGIRGALAGGLLGGVAVVFATTVAVPVASAAPCTASSATGTIAQVSGAASQYLASHPGADQALTNAASQSSADARASVRDYFTAHPGEYFDLKGITAPLVDLQRQCNVAGGPMDLISAFNEFQAG